MGGSSLLQSRPRRDEGSILRSGEFLNDDLLQRARSLLPEMIEVRRRLHRSPEIGLELPQTRAEVVRKLEQLALTPVPGFSVGSATAVIEGSRPGPTVVLRADMDGLPLEEASGLEFASQTPGAMHACGHDLHVAMLLGAARLLVERRELLAGRVLLMFQPGEEGFFGARAMLDEGLLKGLDEGAANAAFALHVFTNYPTGTLHLRVGTMLAASDTIRLTVNGRGGHASAPHRSIDPTTVAAEIILAIHAMATRRLDPFDPTVITIGSMSAGTTPSIIPPTASLAGTIRTVSEANRTAVHAHIRRVVEGICAAHEAVPDLNIEPGYPVTVNDREVSDLVIETSRSLLGLDAVHIMEAPIMAAEDFSYLLQRMPGAIAFLGARPPEEARDDPPMNHSNLVVFDESTMAVGAAVYAAVALARLA